MASLPSSRSVDTKNLSRVAGQGALAVGALVVVSKASAFLGQWVLGLYLMPDEFGILAVISVAMLIVAGLKEVGLNQVLLSNREDFDLIAKPYMLSAQLINLGGVLVLFLCAPVVATIYDDERLLPILIAIAITLPMHSLAVLFRAKLNIGYQFKKVALVEGASVLLMNISLCVSAKLGASVYSYAISQVIAALVMALLYWRVSGGVAKGEKFSLNIFVRAFEAFRWLIMSTYVMNFSLRGDYLVLSFLLNKHFLGIYYFGFQLVGSAIQLISMAISYVILPVFSSIKADFRRLQAGFMRSLRLVSFVSGGFCLVLVVTLPAAVNWLWEGKWDEAVMVSQLILISIPMRLAAIPLGSSVLESLSLYKARFYLLLLDGVSVVIAAFLGGWYGGVISAAIAISVCRASFGTVMYYFACHNLGISMQSSFFCILRLNCSFILSVVGLYLFGFFEVALPENSSDVGNLISSTAFVLFAFVCGFVLFNYRVLNDLKVLLGR